jgi:phosphotransferase system enzyme I (PtsP)
MQFLFAADRENRQVANRFDTLSVPALRALKVVAERAGAAGCPVTVCGEIGGRPLDALALVALGFTRFSMSPASIGPVKAMLLALDAGAAREALGAALGSEPADATLRPLLTAFADRHDIPI